jgi:dihydroorotate dehydrogenase electron transfer subunit
MIDRPLEIVTIRKMTADTYLMGLRSPEIAGGAKAGQFVMIKPRSGSEPLLRRPFSISGTRDDLFLIIYRVVGQGTALMAEKREGDYLSVLGPLGNGFALPTGPEKCLLVGGGVGVAPLFFLAQKIETSKIELMMGFATAGEILNTEALNRPNIKTTISTDDGTYGFTGPATDLLAAYLDRNKNEKEGISIYTCGPKPMLKKVAAMAMDLNLSCQVSLEAAMACGLGACLGCAVKGSAPEGPVYQYVCKNGPVFPARVIDWNAM